jgi:hypothetical protein
VSIGELLRVVAEDWLVYQCTIQGAHQPPGKGPLSTAKLRIDLVHLPERSKVLKRSFSLLRLRAACVPHALYPTDEFDAPSHRKDTKPENTRVQPSQGVPTFHLANIEPAHLDACVVRQGLVQEWGGPEAAVRQGVLRACFTTYKQINMEIR